MRDIRNLSRRLDWRWSYSETPHGFVIQCLADGVSARDSIAVIPWRQIEAAMKRKRRFDAKR